MPKGRPRERLVLVHREASYAPGQPRVPGSLATRTLAATLSRRLPSARLEAMVVDVPRDATRAEAVELVLRHEPDVVGFSTYVWNASEQFALADAVRRRDRHLYTIFGGPQMFYDDADLARLFAAHPGIDVVVSGEGEEALAGLLDTAPRRRPGRGTRIAGTPSARLERFDHPLYETYLAPAPTSYLDIECTRGCRRRCAYCTMPQLGNRVRTRPMEHVAIELRWAVQHGVSSVFHVSSALNHVPGLLERLLSTARAADPESRLFHQTSLNCAEITQDDVDRFAGLRCSVALGIQSTSSVTNRLMGRTFDSAQFARVVERFRRAGVEVFLHLILGLPGDSTGDFEKTLRYALSFGLPLGVFVLLVLPGSLYYRRRAELGIAFDPDRYHRVLRTATMSTGDIDRSVDLLKAAAEEERGRGRAELIALSEGCDTIHLIPRAPRSRMLRSDRDSGSGLPGGLRTLRQ